MSSFRIKYANSVLIPPFNFLFRFVINAEISETSVKVYLSLENAYPDASQ